MLLAYFLGYVAIGVLALFLLNAFDPTFDFSDSWLAVIWPITLMVVIGLGVAEAGKWAGKKVRQRRAT